MSTLLLIIIFGVIAIGLWLGYLAFRGTSDRTRPAEPPEPAGTHLDTPKSTAEKKARE